MINRILTIHTLYSIFCILFILSYSSAYGAEGTHKISSGKNLPKFSLNTPASVKDQKYLGLKDVESFSLSDVPSKLILVEVFSAYCSVCYKQAPIANKLFKLIEQDKDLRQDIKLIGIGGGDKQKAVNVFKNKLHVQFPLFSDPKGVVFEKLGKPLVPFMILVRNSGEVLSTHSGLIKNMDEFLREIRKFHQKQ